MRIALAVGLCLIAFVAMGAPRGKGDVKPRAQNPTLTENLREAYRSRVNENVVTIMAGSPSGTDLGIAFFTFLGVVAFLRVVERVTPLRVALA